jgi:hypothetical protein
VTYFNWFLALLFLALVLADFFLARQVRLSGAEFGLGMVPWTRVALLAIAFVCYLWRPAPRLVDAAGLFLWSGMFVYPLWFLVLIAGRTRFGLVDRQLAEIDGWMHFSTAYITHLVAQAPLLGICFLIVYASFTPMVISAIAIPSLSGQTAVSRRFVMAMIFAMLLTTIVFAFTPAAGPWTTEALQPSKIQAMITDYLLLLKSGVPLRAELGRAAIVSFPSVHVAVAILSAQALASVRSVKFPARILCILVCISAITTGWHYGIDLLGGAVVALISRRLATKVCGQLEEWDNRAPMWLGWRKKQGIH